MNESPAADDDAVERVVRRIRSRSPGWVHRLRQALAIEALFLVVPLAVGALLGPPGAGLAAVLGSVIVFASATANGLVATRYATPVMLIAAVLGALTKPDWWWVPVLAVFAFASGLGTLWGAGVALAGATLWAVSAPSVQDVDHLALLVGYMVLGSLFGWLVCRRIGVPVTSPAPRPTQRYALTLATSLAVAVAIAAGIAVATGWDRSSSIVAAVVVLGVPAPGITEGRIAQSALGTFAGCVLVISLSLVTDDPIAVAVCVFVCLTLYLMAAGQPLAVQVMLLTSVFMLPSAASTGATALAAQRLGYTAIGLGIMALVLVVLRFTASRATPRVEPA
jgi:hypothetical protein